MLYKLVSYIPATQQKFNEILAALKKGEEGVFVLFYAPGIGKMGLLKEIAWGTNSCYKSSSTG